MEKSIEGNHREEFRDDNALPLITVISVSYNAGVDATRRTIESVLGQSYPGLEYIVVDNCSNDGSEKVIAHFKDRISKLIVEKDKGPYYAMNKGIRVSGGHWLIFMNMGDSFPGDPDLLMRVVARPCVNNALVLYGNTFVEMQGAGFQKNFDPAANGNLNCGLMLLNHQAMMISRQLFNELGLFDEARFRIRADTYLLTRAYLKFGSSAFCHTGEVMAIFNGEGISSNAEAYQRIFREDKMIITELYPPAMKLKHSLKFRLLRLRMVLIKLVGQNNWLYQLYRKKKYGIIQIEK